jgi:hypothetical protein
MSYIAAQTGSMELKQFFLEQLEQEAASSRKALQQVPEGQNGWKPHEKSMELGYLAALVATIPGGVAMMIEDDETNLDSPTGRCGHTPWRRAPSCWMLDAGLAKSRAALAQTTEEHLLRPWRLMMDGRQLTEGLRYRTIADGALSHLANHRGQLTVYLLLNNAKVPAIYSPSADERYS